jgi:peptide/nickel transport system permease protein
MAKFDSAETQRGTSILLKLILSRFIQIVIVLLLVSLLTFALLSAAGGDALTALAGESRVSSESIEAMRRVYGLDKPLPLRYLNWLADALRGRMGDSFYFHAPVAQIIFPRLVATLSLAVAALLVALIISIALGSLAVRYKNSWLDKFCSLLILLASSTPRIVVALVALSFVVRSSFFAIGAAAENENFAGKLARLLLPAFVLSVPLIALFLAQARDGLDAVLREDFIRVARAKGLSERTLILRHALRAALNPLITIFGYSLGALVSGSVIVEATLGWSGIGQLSVIAVKSRDVPLLMSVVLVTATAVLIGNLLADVLLHLNDPRLRSKTESIKQKM